MIKMASKKAGEYDITRNIRLIEWLKSEMLSSVARLFSLLSGSVKASQDALTACLGNIIVACYLLGKRLGLHYALIDRVMEDQLRLGIIEDNDIEQSYGDLTELLDHLGNSHDNDRNLL